MTFAGRRTRSGRSRSRRPVGTTCSWSARRAWARRCSPGACRESSRRPTSTRRSRSPRCTARPASGPARSCASGPFGLRTTRSRRRAWSAAELCRAPGRSRSPIAECSSSTSWLSSRAWPSMRSGSRSRRDGFDIMRGQRALEFPANPVLVAACNRCPCGRGSERCRCSQADRDRYLRRLSLPLLDRLDLVCEVRVVPPLELAGAKPQGPSSGAVRKRVMAARERQRKRLKGTAALCNGDMDGRLTRRRVSVDGDAVARLIAARESANLSGRGHDRVLRVARTIADLGGRARVHAPRRRGGAHLPPRRLGAARGMNHSVEACGSVSSPLPAAGAPRAADHRDARAPGSCPGSAGAA